MKLTPSDLTDEQIATILQYGSTGLATEHIELLYEDTGPGKFEGNDNPGLAAAIWEKSLEGWDDASTGDNSEWHYHVSLLGRFMLIADSQGFVCLEEYTSTAQARRMFEVADEEYAKAMETVED